MSHAKRVKLHLAPYMEELDDGEKQYARQLAELEGKFAREKMILSQKHHSSLGGKGKIIRKLYSIASETEWKGERSQQLLTIYPYDRNSSNPIWNELVDSVKQSPYFNSLPDTIQHKFDWMEGTDIEFTDGTNTLVSDLTSLEDKGLVSSMSLSCSVDSSSSGLEPEGRKL